MSIYTSTEPSIIKFTKHLGEILELCNTGISLNDDCPGILFARTEQKMFINSNLLDYFDVIPSEESKPKKFSFFVGKTLSLREINGDQRVLQLEDRNYNTLELKMKSDIGGILRRKKLVHIKKETKRKRHNHSI